MKTIRETYANGQSVVKIFPFIGPNESHMLGADEEFAGEEMGCIEVTPNGLISLTWAWEGPPFFSIEEAKQLARGLLEATSISHDIHASRG